MWAFLTFFSFPIFFDFFRNRIYAVSNEYYKNILIFKGDNI